MLASWELRCKAQGLSVTASRRAILAAMLQSGAACDAVTLLLAAQEHRASTSIGTVYRFLRELEQRGLVDVQAAPHARCHWRLRDESPASSPAEVSDMLDQLQDFLRDMETLGFAEALQASCTEHARSIAPSTGHKPATPAWQLLQRIAERLGYRLLPRQPEQVY
jgi:predicted ArsR family transcriptional regulator